MLDLVHVSKTFNPGTVNEKKALDDVTLHLEKGDFVTLIGSNGAGKSTLMAAVAGEFYPDAGRVSPVSYTHLDVYKRQVYNVGGHNERPNIFIVKTIIAQLHQRLADDAINETLIRYVADRLGHDRRYGIDPEKIKKELGWYPETPFEEGIVKTIDWYLAHEEWMANVTSGSYQKYYQEMCIRDRSYIR